MTVEPSFIIVDTDAGIDDAWALLLLISAKQKLKIAGITCVNGNTTVDNVCINILRTLEVANCLNIPVYKGASTPLICLDESQKINFHGIDGFGDAHFDKKVDASLIKEENAVLALNRIVTEHKDKVSLLCLGPLTNIALAIRTFPTFQHNVKDIYFMGGNYEGVGNTTNSAEFNFWADPEAAQIVLGSEIKTKFMVPWETCKSLPFTLNWRDNMLGKSNNAAVRLMNKAEEGLRKKPTFTNWVPADQVIAAYLIDNRTAIQLVPLQATVELHGMHTRGQVVVGHKSKGTPNVQVIQKVNREVLEGLLLDIHSLP